MASGRKPGRPRKNPVKKEVEVSTPEMAEDFLHNVSHSDTPAMVVPVKKEPKAVFPFTAEERERIKSCDEVYLVTKNAVRLENGSRDKQVHDMSWLREFIQTH